MCPRGQGRPRDSTSDECIYFLPTLYISYKYKDLLILRNARCLNNHEPVYVTKMIAFICSNILLNNFCSLKNDTIKA